jgi:hypothetical protein
MCEGFSQYVYGNVSVSVRVMKSVVCGSRPGATTLPF